MSRLLFAAARGARTEYMQTEGLMQDWGWTILHSPVIDLLLAFPDSYRIHPDDAHLQYGPISTALRDAAEAGSAWDLTGRIGRAARVIAEWHDYNWFMCSGEQRVWFLLILAEALADEGL